MYRLIAEIGRLIATSSAVVARVLLAFVAFVLLLQVILRYVFNAALPWPEEASKYSMIWVVCLMGNVLIRDKQLITVDFLDMLWSRKLIIYRDNLYRLLLLFLLWILFKEGLIQTIYGWKTITTTLRIRWFWPYLAVPVGTGLMLVQMIFLILNDLINKKRPGRE
jgi:TRAP-type C4-dicarboxylate transport system permease small subunit